MSRVLKVSGIFLKSSVPAKRPSLTGLTRARTGDSQVDTPARYCSLPFIDRVMHTRKAAKGLCRSVAWCSLINRMASGSHFCPWIALPATTAR